MKTVTFFSYKGGTGRSLAVANASFYLARLGFKVAAMDFDLEAPGLHYKFRSPNGGPMEVKGGVVDYLHEMLHGTGSTPPDLAQWVLPVPVEKSVTGSITLVPAGRVPSPSYWPKLAGINWHQLLYAPDGVGVKLFLELKQRLAGELQPDFLLIDSRTGVTEMAGVATSILADAVIALVLNTLENLEGSRAVLRSLVKTRRSFQLPPLVLTVALSRFPSVKEESEQQIVDEIRRFLNEPAEELGETLAIDKVEVLHIDEALHQKETLRVGGALSPDESILYRDYLRLFHCLVPEEEMAHRMGAIITKLRERLLESPESVERDLEELALIYGHPNAYKELLLFYRLRNNTSDKALRQAQTYWEIGGRDGQDPLLWFFVNLGESLGERGQKTWKPDLNFLASVWRGAGKKNPEFASKLAKELKQENSLKEAARILSEAVQNDDVPLSILLEAINAFGESGETNQVCQLVERFKVRYGTSPEFLEVWARLALNKKLSSDIKVLTEQTPLSILKLNKPQWAVRLLMAAGRQEEAFKEAVTLLDGCTEVSEFYRVYTLFNSQEARQILLAKAKERLADRDWRDLRRLIVGN
jgi:MinD-like ATPase involved in chromosome partitioning or flagellar assembly